MYEGSVSGERRLQLLIDSMRDYAIFMLDATGHVETWNLGAQLIKGYQAHEIIGRTIHEFYTREDREAQRPDRLLDEARAHGRVEDEGWRVRKDGTRFWADVVITALREADGELVGFLKVTRDLSERRKSEQDRLRLVHAEEALRLRDEFLSIASHELRTPMVALHLQLDSLRTYGNLEAKQLGKLDRAIRNVHRLTELINTLLDATRIAQRQITIAPTRGDLAELVGDAVDRLKEPAHEARCAVTTDLAEGLVGDWDALRVGQVVSNLLSNAFKYAPGTAVDVRLVRDGDLAVLSVEDRGPGIGAEHLERIFGRFERAVSSKNFGGLGLGLYLAREIAIAHGGDVSAANRDGGGARLEVRLPLRKEEVH